MYLVILDVVTNRLVLIIIVVYLVMRNLLR